MGREESVWKRWGRVEMVGRVETLEMVGRVCRVGWEERRVCGSGGVGWRWWGGWGVWRR